MEEKHYTREKLEQFLRDELPAEELVEILVHLDECEQCRNLIPDEKAKEIIEKLFTDDEEDDSN